MGRQLLRTRGRLSAKHSASSDSGVAKVVRCHHVREGPSSTQAPSCTAHTHGYDSPRVFAQVRRREFAPVATDKELAFGHRPAYRQDVSSSLSTSRAGLRQRHATLCLPLQLQLVINSSLGKHWVLQATTRRSRSTGVANPTPSKANLSVNCRASR